MEKCWQIDPHDRPTFAQIAKHLLPVTEPSDETSGRADYMSDIPTMHREDCTRLDTPIARGSTSNTDAQNSKFIKCYL